MVELFTNPQDVNPVGVQSIRPTPGGKADTIRALGNTAVTAFSLFQKGKEEKLLGEFAGSLLNTDDIDNNLKSENLPGLTGREASSFTDYQARLRKIDTLQQQRGRTRNGASQRLALVREFIAENPRLAPEALSMFNSALGRTPGHTIRDLELDPFQNHIDAAIEANAVPDFQRQQELEARKLYASVGRDTEDPIEDQLLYFRQQQEQLAKYKATQDKADFLTNIGKIDGHVATQAAIAFAAEKMTELHGVLNQSLQSADTSTPEGRAGLLQSVRDIKTSMVAGMQFRLGAFGDKANITMVKETFDEFMNNFEKSMTDEDFKKIASNQLNALRDTLQFMHDSELQMGPDGVMRPRYIGSQLLNDTLKLQSVLDLIGEGPLKHDAVFMREFNLLTNSSPNGSVAAETAINNISQLRSDPAKITDIMLKITRAMEAGNAGVYDEGSLAVFSQHMAALLSNKDRALSQAKFNETRAKFLELLATPTMGKVFQSQNNTEILHSLSVPMEQFLGDTLNLINTEMQQRTGEPVLSLVERLLLTAKTRGDVNHQDPETAKQIQAEADRKLAQVKSDLMWPQADANGNVQFFTGNQDLKRDALELTKDYGQHLKRLIQVRRNLVAPNESPQEALDYILENGDMLSIGIQSPVVPPRTGQ